MYGEDLSADKDYNDWLQEGCPDGSPYQFDAGLIISFYGLAQKHALCKGSGKTSRRVRDASKDRLPYTGSGKI